MEAQKITLDFYQNDYKAVKVKQYDKNSRNLIITCTDNGTFYKLNPISLLCNIKMNTPDGRAILETATINEDGTVLVTFTESMVYASGTGQLELDIIDSSADKSISTMILTVIIIGSVYPDDKIIASDEFNALTEALLTVGEFSELINSVDAIEANEEIRIANEEERKEVFEDMVADLQAEIDAIPDGVVRVDFVDETEVDIVPIERINGISLYVEDEDIIASWDNNGETKEVNLSNGSGGSTSSGFNDIYAETSLNLGRQSDTTIGEYSGVIGQDNTVTAESSMAFGFNNIVNTKFSTALGYHNQIKHSTGYTYDEYGGSFVSGSQNDIYCNGYNTVLGYGNTINFWIDSSYNQNRCSTYCFGVGCNNTLYGSSNIALGYQNTSTGRESSIAMGRENKSTGISSIALGSYCEASNSYSFAGGVDSKSSGAGSFAFGHDCEATGQDAISLGCGNKATNTNAFASCYNSTASGFTSIAMGYEAKATGTESVAIGSYNEANASQSLALGEHSVASAYNSKAIGYYAKASSGYQTVLGKYNVEDTESKYALIFGGGDYSENKNIFTLDWDGNAQFSGTIVDKNGEDVNGIGVAINSNISTSLDGNIILSASGNYIQDILEGLSLYKFEDTTVTQNGVTVTIKDNVCSWSGTPTITTNGAIIYDIYLAELDLSLLTENQYLYMKGYGGFDVYDLDGNLLESNVWKYYYSSSTVGKIVPHLRSEYWGFNEGSSLMMIFQSSEEFDYWNDLSKIPLEPYVNRIPTPNPNYSQSITFSSISSIILENENGNTIIDFGEEIILYSTGNIDDSIVSTSIERKVATVTLTGTETIGGDASAGYFTYSPTIAAKAGSVNVLSDHYRNVNGDSSETDYNIFIDESGNIRIQHSGFTSIDEYKAWLTSNNVVIAYERAETEVVVLSDEVSTVLKNLKIYSGETTVTTSSTIQPIIKIEYPTSKMGKYVLEILSIVKNLKNAEGGAY